MATDEYRALALECDDLPDDSLLRVFSGDVSPVLGDTTRSLMAKVAQAPTRVSIAQHEATLLAYRKATLDVRAEIIESFGCQACNLGKSPSVIAGNVYLDAVSNITGTIFGGDAFGLGDPGCTAVRHEIRVTDDSSFIDSNAGVVVHSWAEEVVNQAPVNQNFTLTSAQHASLGSPSMINVWIRSYTCNDLAFKEDFAGTFVYPFKLVSGLSVALGAGGTFTLYPNDVIDDPNGYSDFTISKDGNTFAASVDLDCTDYNNLNGAYVYVRSATPSVATSNTFVSASDPLGVCGP